jgi:phenylalanyl-tRNA synthetase beta chain
VARIHGYEKIAPIMPTSSPMSKPGFDKPFYYSEKIKNILAGLGFSEVYLYSLVSKGDVEIEKSLASDKNFLRTNLSDGISKSLELNAKNADLLGLGAIKIFEIGKVFTKEGEFMNLAIGATQVKKVKGLKGEGFVSAGIEALEKELGVSITNKKIAAQGANSIWEINLSEVIDSLSEPVSYSGLNFQPATNNPYKKFSLYPFIVRDIAVFVPESIQAKEVWATIEKGIAEAHAQNLLVRHSKFDEFKKDGKISYGFRMIFQSGERTLTIEEANAVMEKVSQGVTDKGWEVR